MADCILPAAPKAATHTPQYHLPEADRQAILAQSTFARTRQKIERQRREFMSQNFGCQFGLKTD